MMFDCGRKSEYMGGQRENFLRLEALDSTLSSSSDAGVIKSGFSIDKLGHGGHGSSTTSRSFKRDRKLATIVTTLRTVIDAFYLMHMALQFRTAYIAPSSRVFGRGELVIDSAQIAKRYLQRYFIIDFLSVLPIPQYVPRFLRMVPLTSELKRTAGVFAETAWAGAACYLLLYMLASHTYLQSLTIRLEEMRVKRRDSEQWMHHRLLPQELRERVRRYDQYKWLATRGVDEENLVQSLPKDLRRDIKRHLCLALVRRVPLFESMDERLLDAICERLKPCLFTEHTYIVREGDPVDEMLFIIRGRLESVTTDGGRSGFFNRSFLKEADFCGEELLTWALDPKSGSNLPSSTRTVKALMEVEAFALTADELKFVASQFRRLHSRQVQHTFRFYSQQWRTWAACFIQAAWRRYSKKKLMKLRQKEEDADESEGSHETGGGNSYSFGAALLASKFAAHTLRGVHRNRLAKTARELVKLQKPPEPDFSADDAD
ncbi:Cyclic nucleotide- and calmodulin-regulated ion channel 9 [Vigna angularis]|uniref:Cyclic nucleotide- and calmodulin-regulated ion channel 9 n=1 Tax=Phaseolus angularis TaxID=3914 RepID=A0A8T0LB90_PHAAN|nr:Cyclic nucleotide- and calmodulin-regulated ion channel 9 [Vigna angularis]